MFGQPQAKNGRINMKGKNHKRKAGMFIFLFMFLRGGKSIREEVKYSERLSPGVQSCLSQTKSRSSLQKAEGMNGV